MSQEAVEIKTENKKLCNIHEHQKYRVEINVKNIWLLSASHDVAHDPFAYLVLHISLWTTTEHQQL